MLIQCNKTLLNFNFKSLAILLRAFYFTAPELKGKHFKIGIHKINHSGVPVRKGLLLMIDKLEQTTYQ